jgi:hypothetical protein
MLASDLTQPPRVRQEAALALVLAAPQQAGRTLSDVLDALAGDAALETMQLRIAAIRALAASR